METCKIVFFSVLLKSTSKRKEEGEDMEQVTTLTMIQVILWMATGICLYLGVKAVWDLLNKPWDKTKKVVPNYPGKMPLPPEQEERCRYRKRCGNLYNPETCDNGFRECFESPLKRSTDLSGAALKIQEAVDAVNEFQRVFAAYANGELTPSPKESLKKLVTYQIEVTERAYFMLQTMGKFRKEMYICQSKCNQRCVVFSEHARPILPSVCPYLLSSHGPDYQKFEEV